MATTPSPTKKLKPEQNLRWEKNGPEDLLILNALNNGHITTETPPSVIAKKYPNELGGYSSQVLRNHIQLLKVQWANHNGRNFTGRE